MIPGDWTRDRLRRPIVSALFIHPKCCPRGHYLDFVIDTAADRSFIVPAHQKQIPIRDDEKLFASHPLDTLVGWLPFKFLRRCTLVFERMLEHGNDAPPKPIVKSGLDIYFAAPVPATLREVVRKTVAKLGKRKRDRLLVGEGEHYSVLGRDVLQKFSIGYCNPMDILFLSTQNAQYKDALQSHFLDRYDIRP